MQQFNEWYVKRARQRYAPYKDIRLDVSPAVAVADDGAWVQAWVWIDNPASGGTSLGRVARGIDLAMSGEDRGYLTTPHNCTCPDRFFRGVTCKHMVAAALKQRGTVILSN